MSLHAPPWSLDRLDTLNRLTLAARLLSTAVHETGNALQIVSGNAELIAAQPTDPDRTRARAETIKSHADRAGLRLRALVALASGPETPRRPVDLRDVAERAVDLRRYTLARAGVAVALDAGAPVRALADEQALVRILANLILNAETAMAAEKTRALGLAIGSDGPTATVTVTDSGPGVPASRTEAIFEPFAGDGGCGLAVSRYLAECQGGTLRVDPAHAGGAAFVLTLPAL